LILIDKEESLKVRAAYPHAEIIRTCIQKSKRHHYYLPEKESYLRLIQDSNYLAKEICDEIDARRARIAEYYKALEEADNEKE